MLGLQPTGELTARVAALHSSNEPSELSQWLSHDDGTTNIVLVLLLLLLLLLCVCVCVWVCVCVYNNSNYFAAVRREIRAVQTLLFVHVIEF